MIYIKIKISNYIAQKWDFFFFFVYNPDSKIYSIEFLKITCSFGKFVIKEYLLYYCSLIF